MLAAKITFWISVALVFYAYAGYPLLLSVLQFLFRRPVKKSPIEPSVSLLISAYNEADVIAEKVRNSLQLDYSAEKLEVVVASDGSTDETARIVRRIAESEGAGRVRLLEFVENRGKVTALNDSIPQLKGEIVVFSDASSMLAPDAIRKLVANFADARVGAASGVYQVLNKHTSTLGHQEDFYWKYETFLKLQEAKIGALAGAHGSLYAMRRALYPFPPPDTINDDFVIPTSVLKRGLRIAYEPTAVAYEEAHEMAGFGRRVRIMAGNIDQMREARGLLWPPRLIPLFCFLSHKGTRIIVPLAMLAAFVVNLLLWQFPLFRWIMWGQVAFYAAAVLGALGILRWKVLKLPYYFCMINASLFAWIYYRLTGRLRRSSAGPRRPGVVWT